MSFSASHAVFVAVHIFDVPVVRKVGSLNINKRNYETKVTVFLIHKG